MIPKTDASRATIPIPTAVAREVEDHFSRFGGTLVFETPSDKPLLYRTLMKIVWEDPDSTDPFETRRRSKTGPWYRAVYEADIRDDKGDLIRITPHDLRHSFSQWLYNSGVPMLDHQRLMRHASQGPTLRVYTRADAAGELSVPELPES